MNAPDRPREITLDDKYTLQSGRAFMTGTQALVRLPMLQRVRDLAAGLNTAGFISGYRGSPLGGFDQALWKARKFLDEHHVKFQPGVNEDLAATSIWGTQQVNLFPDAKYDGVFSLWYGKGPGVDRCGDVFKHANSAGTSKHGGVLVLAGDDHAAKSSTLAHQSEHLFKACCIPVLNAASVQEYLDLGLHGIAMSRFSGCWVAFKCVTDVVESGAVVEIDPQRVKIVTPDFAMPPGGLNIRWPDAFLEQEARLLDYKVYAALAYCRANRLDRIVWDSPRARFGIITTGKSFGDTLQALADLGIDESVARATGIRLYKVAMSWPLEPQGARKFAEGLEEILVVEEKRQVIEYQIKEELYNWREGMHPPRIVGKFDDNGEWSIAEGQPAGNWLLPAHYELSAALIATALASRLAKLGLDPLMGDRYRERVAYLEFKDKTLAMPRVVTSRLPYFCSGCPHNTSTKVPEGSRAMAGIGCHFMAVWMDRNTSTFTHMGAEGAPWIGQAPFTHCPHVFANLGDGTYYHSGLLAIRDCGADGEQPGVVIRPVAEVGEYVRAVGEGSLPDPGRAFGAHVRECGGIAVHPDRHEVAADARHGAAAFGHLGRSVVRAARAEVGQAARHDARHREGLVLEFQVGDALAIAIAHERVEPELRQAARERLGDQRGGQLVMRGEQPVARGLAFGDRPLAVVVEFADDARRVHALAPVVQLFLDLVLDDLALFLDHEDLFEPFGELARTLRLERPGHRHLVETDAGRARDTFVDTEIGERLQGVAERRAGSDDAETGAWAVPDDAVEPVRAAVGECRVDLVVEQPCLLLEKCVRPADVEAPRRQGEVGRDDLHALRIDLHHRARLDHVGDALEGYPASGETRQGDAVQTEIQIFLDARGVEHRDAAGLEEVFALMRQRSEEHTSELQSRGHLVC